MHRKTLIAIGVALAMQTYYPPVMAAERSEEEKRCPANLSLLSASEREKLPAACRAEDDDNAWAWAVGGVAALSGIALAVHNSNDDSSSSHHTTPLPPDDDGDITPTPPDDSGDITPTPPDDGGDITPTPPDDGSDIIPTPPDDNTPVPPDDSDNDVDPPASPVVFDNNVVWDKAAGTLTIRSTTFTYSENADGTYTLVTKEGNSVLVKKWEIDEAANTIQIDGSSVSGVLKWRYDDDGKAYVMKEAGMVADDPAINHIISVNDATITDQGGNTALNGATVMEINGDNITLNNNGNTVATGEGSVVVDMKGDNITINNNGDMAIDGGTAGIINGDNAIVYNRGDTTISHGGTGVIINGHNALVDNIGHASVEGENSVLVKIKGDDANVKLEGDLYVSQGAHGINVEGAETLASNKGNITVVDKDSIGVALEGNKATFINMGDISASQGTADSHALGVLIAGDSSTFINVGDMSASNAATGVKIAGDKGNIALAGAVKVGENATGLDIAGDNNTLKLATYALDVTGQNATGVNIAGDNNALEITGNMTASVNGTGIIINGDNTTTLLDGNMYVNAEKNSRGAYRSAVGIEVNGSGSNIDINGNIFMGGDFPADGYVSDPSLFEGIIITGDDNNVDLGGTLNISIADMALSSGSAINAYGLDIIGDGNTVNLMGGLNIDYQTTADTASTTINAINIYGDSDVVLGGNSTLNLTTWSNPNLIAVYQGGTLLIDENASVDITKDSLQKSSNTDVGSMLTVKDKGSTIENKGSITSHGEINLISTQKGASVSNTGDISVYINELTSGALARTTENESTIANKAGGSITLVSTVMPEYTTKKYYVPQANYDGILYGLMAKKYGHVINEAGATITLNGAGVYGVGAIKGDALNEGNIYLDGFKPVLDANDNVISESYWRPGNIVTTSAGMVAGSTVADDGDATAINTGDIVVKNAGFGMMALNGGAAINRGTITLEADAGVTKTDDNQLVGMAALNGGTVINDTTGTININADYGKPFYTDASSVVINYGTVCLGSNCQDSATYNPTDNAVSDAYNSGMIKQDSVTVEGVNGNNGNTPASAQTNNLSGYVVGTRADGSAGQLKVSNASMNGVGINTGFTAGTADTTVTFDNVVQGSNLTDADAIRSTSVVWNAQGSTDNDGNVDVTMSKNAYTDVATDGSVSDVAKALDAGYTSNELYSSLNVGTTAELNSALKQISGSQASTVFREARVLSNRFNMLADAAPQVKDGLAFNLVAKGDPRAELGNDTQYDMLALRQTLDLSASQDLVMEYGIARLDGSGSQKAGDNGLTGGYSQFFGLKHSLAFEDGLAWNNSLRYDVHNLDSSRAVNYGDTRKVANTDSRQQYMEFRSEGAKTFSALNDTLKVTPYAGLKFRHTLEDGYQERSAGDFNLSMNSGRETAVDSVAGLKLDYAGKNGWSATATLEGGPNLSYSKSQRTASLQGAAGQSFGIDDGQKGGGVNGLAVVGVKYSSDNTTLHLDAYQWKEDSISDKGLMLNFKKTFR